MFAFRLCLELGWPHPDHLLAVLSSAQIAEWRAYFREEPWGYRADWQRAGLLASTVANFSQASKRHDWKPSEFMPDTRKPETLSQRIVKAFAGRATGRTKGRR